MDNQDKPSETNSMFLTLSRWNRVSKNIWCYLCIFLSMTVTPVGACSRVLYRGPDGAVVVGRLVRVGPHGLIVALGLPPHVRAVLGRA